MSIARNVPLIPNNSGEQVDMILDGGPCRVGVESAIVGFAGKVPVLLRPGGILAPALEEALGKKVVLPGAALPSVRTPGSLPSRYARLSRWKSGPPGNSRDKGGVSRLWNYPLNLRPALTSPHLRHLPMPKRRRKQRTGRRCATGCAAPAGKRRHSTWRAVR